MEHWMDEFEHPWRTDEKREELNAAMKEYAGQNDIEYIPYESKSEK